MIRIEGVSKWFALRRGERLPVLDGIDLQVADGEFLALLGPSGCGKSTLLHLIAALEAVSAGLILIDGEAPEAMRARHQLGVAFQEHALLPWLSVRGNLELPYRIAGMPVDAGAIGRLIALVGLEGFEEAYPRPLSGGMRQRAAIARSLCLHPKLLLLDEPFGALDAVTRRHMNLELQRIWMEEAVTTVLVTHSVEEALFLADRVVVLSGRPGRVARIVEVPFRRPRTSESTRTELFHAMTDELTGMLEGVGGACDG